MFLLLFCWVEYVECIITRRGAFAPLKYSDEYLVYASCGSQSTPETTAKISDWVYGPSASDIAETDGGVVLPVHFTMALLPSKENLTPSRVHRVWE
jgi:hypothetical protein